MAMRQALYVGLVALLLTPVVTGASAQTAGATKLGVSVIELADIVKGWSAQRQLLGQPVYNDKDERIGKVEDLIITRERTVPYAIVSAGGFLGIGAHDVAIPTAQFRMTGDRLVLPGATKELIQAMPPFVYAPK
jgi:sporulation protein YlmC with PRC-barrel domain